ncbi:peroxisomal ubiquitin-protein ligase E3 [Schizosaccharomyces cryophilus OY26]|uniref:RING-type E3 ubiquitin transferase n=1 Tax=Schizosaccharomyces cryophilus (strain OY26 / ATCC MYA-4695 / CBS 11777 / NBRC 106824 / NRRL Y48691) TaxID=653667 RepID=S9X628_SCHCR|nr:peroxisomal ubiquitin-protein ligase E3 [Schizosaccharomyces cryophilus OY26]EPY49246.1 peroxisomal ubiquitin-protein ligase E3 [Schizosaccharomyces cryophilus OY26]
MELFSSASPLQIVLSNEIDGLCTQFLRSQIETALKTLTSPRPLWVSSVPQECFSTLANLLYQLSSLGRESLGNEVSRILLVKSNGRSALEKVSPKQQTYEILFNLGSEIILLLLKKWGQHSVRRMSSTHGSHHDHSDSSHTKYELVTRLLVFLKKWMPALSRIFSIIRLLFLINKHHCRSFSQLLLGFHYISLDTSRRNLPSKEFLLLIIYHFIKLAISFLRNTKRGKHLLNPETDQDSWSLEPPTLEDPKAFPFIPAPSRKCALCMEWIHRPTVTECGHIYCWHCIFNWTKTKPECPLCRSFSSPSKLILLR